MSACLIPLIVIVGCAAPGLPGLMSLYHRSVVRVTTPPHQLMSSVPSVFHDSDTGESLASEL